MICMRLMDNNNHHSLMAEQALLEILLPVPLKVPLGLRFKDTNTQRFDCIYFTPHMLYFLYIATI